MTDTNVTTSGTVRVNSLTLTSPTTTRTFTANQLHVAGNATIDNVNTTVALANVTGNLQVLRGGRIGSTVLGAPLNVGGDMTVDSATTEMSAIDVNGDLIVRNNGIVTVPASTTGGASTRAATPPRRPGSTSLR